MLRRYSSLLIVTVFAAACGSPEAPRSGTPAPAANPPSATPAPAKPTAPPAPPVPRSLEGYPEFPQVTAEVSGNLTDLERDIQNIINKQPEAAGEFAEDVQKLAGNRESAAKAPAGALAKSFADVLPAARTAPEFSRRLAELTFIAGRPAPLPEERLKQLEGDVQKLLVDHGVADARAKTIGGQIGSLARTVKRS
jgi:hypothetical protein